MPSILRWALCALAVVSTFIAGDTTTEFDSATSAFPTTDGNITDYSISTDTGSTTVDMDTSTATDSTTVDIDTSTATDSTTLDMETSTTETSTYTTKQYKSTSQQETEITTRDESTTDGTTTAVSTTSKIDVSSAITGSLTTLTDPVTSTAAEATTTAEISTIASESSTFIDPDTTAADSTTTTEVPRSTTLPPTTSADKITTDQSTYKTSAETTEIHVCPTTEVIVQDDIRNYVIIALSVALGIMIILVIIWCVLSSTWRHEKFKKKVIMVSMGTQTGDVHPKKVYFRSLPPIDTRMKVVTAKTPPDAHTCILEKRPVDMHIEIDAEDLQVKTENEILPQKDYQTSVNLPTDDNIETLHPSSGSDQELDTSISVPIYSSSDTEADTVSSESDYTDLPYEDLEDMHEVDSLNENLDTLLSETLFPIPAYKTEPLRVGEKDSGPLFIRTSHASNLDNANKENTISRTNITNVGMENKRPSFQIKQCFHDDEDVEEVITLDTEDKLPKVRHVTFENHIDIKRDHASSGVITRGSDNGLTLKSPKFRGFINTKTKTAETSNEKQKMSTKRKRVFRKKEAYPELNNSSNSATQKRYEATYKMIANACFSSDRTEEKVWKHLKKIQTRKKMKLKVKTKSKRNVCQPEPLFQTAPYSNLYSRLSHFESC